MCIFIHRGFAELLKLRTVRSEVASVNDHSSAPLIDVLRSTSYLLDLYGYSGHYPSLDELQHMIGRAIANLEDASISEASPSPAPTALQIRPM